MQYNSNERNEILDYIKGIGIILMVLGHAGAGDKINNYIYVFHMSIFFICSGFFFKRMNSVGEFIMKKVKRLYVPYVIVGMAFHLGNPILAKLGLIDKLNSSEIFKNMVAILIFRGDTLYTFQMWFLRVLFFSTLIYFFIDLIVSVIVKDEFIQFFLETFFCVTMLLVGYYASVRVPKQYDWNICSVIILLHIGRILKRIDFVNKFLNLTKPTILVLGGGLLILIGFMSRYRVELLCNIIVNPIFFVIGGLGGVVLCTCLYILEMYEKKKKFIIYTGRVSLWVLSLHLVCFKIVTFLQIKLYGENVSGLKEPFYGIYKKNWWIVYTIIGVIVPIGIQMTYAKLVQHYKDSCNKSRA